MSGLDASLQRLASFVTGPTTLQARWEALRWLAQHNLYFLCKGILGFDEAVHPEGRGLSLAFHGPLCRELDGLDLAYGRRVDLWPRGHLKSHIGTIGKGIQWYLQDHDVRILLAGASVDGPVKNLRAIKGQFDRNPLLHWLFPECIPDKKQLWATEEIVLPRLSNRHEATFKCTGVGSHITGHHVNAMIKDDLIDEKHRDSVALMSEAIDWHVLSKNLLDSLATGVDWLIGTRQAVQDVYSWVTANEPEFTVRTIAQLQPEGTLVWPERDTVDAVLEYRKKSPALFACARQNNPRDASLVAFASEWLQYYALANAQGDLLITTQEAQT